MELLTADEVLNKKFMSVRFRPGYNMVEVDEFIDQVVFTIYQLETKIAELS